MTGPTKNTEKRSYTKRNTIVDQIQGKIPPQAVDIEEAILGAFMLDVVPVGIWNQVKPEFFYKEQNQKIFKAILLLKEENSPIDILSVTQKLRKLGELEMIGGSFYVTELTEKVTGAANIEYHIKIVHEKFLSRELIRMSAETMNAAYEDTHDPFSLMTSNVVAIDRLKKDIFKRSEKTAAQVLKELDKVRLTPKQKGLIGLTTGKKGLDSITKGDQPGQFRIKAARPAMGKSADMCSEIVSCGYENNIPVACFSLEMSNVDLAFRMVADISGIPVERIEQNIMNTVELEKYIIASEKFSNAPIYIDDTPGLTIDEFETKAALIVSNYGVRKIYIDYLQLMKGSTSKKYGNREAEVSDISRRLKICAKELDITIIALCQLSREVEKRANCTPILADLRESGSIEQDADVVEFLWRPEYYPDVVKAIRKDGSGISIPLFNLNITDLEGLLISIVAKVRKGKTGYIPMKFNGSIMKISDHPDVLNYLNNTDFVFQLSDKETDTLPF